MNRPTRQTAAGRAYLDLQNRARRERRPTQELLTLYVLERWLARMTASPYANTFVLKGGMLLAVFDARRPTADADLLAQHLVGDETSVASSVKAVAETDLDEDDGPSGTTPTGHLHAEHISTINGANISTLNGGQHRLVLFFTHHCSFPPPRATRTTVVINSRLEEVR